MDCKKKYSNGSAALAEDSANISNGSTESTTTPIAACATSFRTEPPQAKSVYNEVTNENDEDEADDEYCIYTYKGDSRGVADLPSSFFKFDQGDSLSSVDENSPSPSSLPLNIRLGYKGVDSFSSTINATTTIHHHTPNGGVVTVSGSRVNGAARAPNDLFSPDMDFLEMDFDPGGLGDDEDDTPSSHQNRHSDGNDIDQILQKPKTKDDSCHPGPSNSSRGEVPLAIDQEIDVTDGTNEIHPKLSSTPVSEVDDHRDISEQINMATEIAECTNSLANDSLLPCLPSPINFRPPSPLPHCSRNLMTHFHQNPPLLNPQICLGQEPWNSSNSSSRQIMMRLVKSNTLPEIRSYRIKGEHGCDGDGVEAVSNGQNTPPRINKQSCLSSSAPVIKNEPYYRAIINTSLKSSANGEDSVELEVGSIMIWTVEDVFQRSLLQIGTSACGATAVCNVLKALGYDHIDPAYVNSCVQTRLRDNTAEIPEYLFSRSVAGATHEDLINGIVKATNGLVNGRFFQPKPGIESASFSKWLLHWICKGAVPVVTLNLQLQTRNESPQPPIPDAWHHQMIFGISPDGIFMTNPIECLSPTLVIPQLTSPSVLLVRRSDVINRRTPSTDLRKLMRHPNARWNELNVLGQVANLLLEEVPVFSSTSIAKRVRTTHIQIPAAYKGGVTLFLPTNSPFYSLLQEAPKEL